VDRECSDLPVIEAHLGNINQNDDWVLMVCAAGPSISAPSRKIWGVTFLIGGGSCVHEGYLEEVAQSGSDGLTSNNYPWSGAR